MKIKDEEKDVMKRVLTIQDISCLGEMFINNCASGDLCARSGLDWKQLDNLIINKAKLWLDAGWIFGKPGRGFQRINVACPRSVLNEALERLCRVMTDEFLC